MAQFYSDQISNIRGNTALGGLQGAPKLGRNQEVMGGLQCWRFSFTQPAAGGAVFTDVIDLAYLKPTARLYYITITNANVAWIATSTFSVGRVDPNNSANNSATRYVNAKAMSAAIALSINDMITSVLGEQVGTDNLGDQSTGNTPPSFGAAPIIIQGTFGVATPAAGAILSGYLLYVEGDQA